MVGKSHDDVEAGRVEAQTVSLIVEGLAHLEVELVLAGVGPDANCSVATARRQNLLLNA